MPVTLRDVAQKAGCAISTASDVLNRKHRMFPISSNTQNRVFSAAEELGYHPNLLAKSLRRQKSNNIGIIASSRLREMNDLFMADIMSGVGATLDDSDYNMIIYGGYEDIKRRIISAANSKTIDGLLYLIHTSTYDLFHNDIVHELGKLDIPVMGMQFFERHEATRSVGLRSCLNPQLAVRHLYEQGCRSVGMLSQSHRRLIGFQESEQGFLEICNQLRLSAELIYSPELFDSFTDTSCVYTLGKMYAEHIIASDQLADGYYIGSDIIAAGFCDTLAQHGISVPQQVAVVGLGNALNEERGSTFYSTINNRRSEIAALAAKRLLDVIADPKNEAHDAFVCLEPELIVRSSSRFGQKTQSIQGNRS
jgi:DNA-binding LacI/PurR family transcriptional regulator